MPTQQRFRARKQPKKGKNCQQTNLSFAGNLVWVLSSVKNLVTRFETPSITKNTGNPDWTRNQSALRKAATCTHQKVPGAKGLMYSFISPEPRLQLFCAWFLNQNIESEILLCEINNRTWGLYKIWLTSFHSLCHCDYDYDIEINLWTKTCCD